jgi:Tol biopolymer transport system component
VNEIGVARTDGGEERTLVTAEIGALAGPRWSPDGRWIAVSASAIGLSESAAKFVLLVRSDGSETRRLHPPVEGGDVSGVAWLAGGEEIVYTQGESVSTVTLSATLINAGASRIWRQHVGSGRGRVILWTPSLSSLVEVAGPGYLVFDSISGRQNLEEHALPPAGAAAGVVLAAGTSIDRQPVYTPDGRWVAFSSNRSGNLDIWARCLAGGELRRLTDHPADDWDPAFTRDGRRLIWTSRRGGNFEIWMADAGGSGARQVTRDGVDSENATATPDGSWLVYNSGHPGKSGIWKIRTDGTGAERLVEGTYSWPEVSPDGRHASYAQLTSSGRVEVRVVRIADGQVEPFTIGLSGGGGEGTAGRTRWLPDGRIAFNWNAPGRAGIYAQEFRPGVDTTSTRRPLVLLGDGAMAETFGISPDGSRVVVAVSHRNYSIMSAEGLPGVEPPRRGR